MSSVCGKLDFKDASFEISASSPTQCCSKGSKHTSFTGSEDSQETDGDETGYIHQTVNEDTTYDKDSSKSTLSPNSSDDEDKDENLTTTPPVVLIPAIKGSREKHGFSLRKTSVSWAADVYDPPPSIASHTRSKKQQQKPKIKDNHRKTGKKGQKSKDNSSSRGGSSKDKKKASRKHSCEKFEWVTQMPLVAASS
ncbi:PREDICTED: uncharacterized protein LOC104792534 [Camelina sativa]|uniref:Uncharacterized protein LOC104792534 n=1 Tax=Camelina sativa TaxID=90675 RepID=A0ABM0ZKH8_CAMSA|nr:PREDICTED: uncharacterized protein LOC104792534 [Camelina sativa]